MAPSSTIILTGFMGTGKTEVGRLVASRLKWNFLDTDAEIERREKMTIPEIFATHGERHFRALEKNLLRELNSRAKLVVATGGGMPVDPDNRKALTSSGLVICLRSSPEQILARVGCGDGRPMLEGDDPVGRVLDLLRAREPAYASLPFHVDTTNRSIREAADRVFELAEDSTGSVGFLSVSTVDGGGYTIALGPGVLDLVGDMIRDRGLTSRVAVVTDTNVGPLYLDLVMESLRAAGLKPFSCEVPAGERSKTLPQLEFLYDSFLERGLDRRGAVVALGGGVVGDLAGYAAATYMRGVKLIQCPTTLLAMVDSSVGGKTGIDLPKGKNLVGAFKQPLLVGADTRALESLPAREIQVGMAELIKHAVIDDANLFAELETLDGQPGLDPSLIARSVAVKIRVVEADPFESNRREVLNLGHTVGHALEKCSDYRMSHGDAVSVGMIAAARISHRKGLCNPDVPDRVERILKRAGLPIRHEVNLDGLMDVMGSDKKVVEGKLRFVLIRDIGQVEYGWHVEPNLVESVLTDLKETRS